MNKKVKSTKRKQTQCLRPKQSRNVQATKQRFYNAIGEMILESGISSLRVNHIAARAGRNKGLLYQYFKNLKGLLKEYLELNDDFLAYEKKLAEMIEEHRHDNGRELGSLILKNHFQNFRTNKLLQQVSLLELTEKTDLLVELSNSRERLGDQLFAISEELFRNSGINIRMVEGLLIGAINYVVLHSETNGVEFCGVDIKKVEGRDILRKTLHQIITWAFNEAEAIKSGNRSN